MFVQGFGGRGGSNNTSVQPTPSLGAGLRHHQFSTASEVAKNPELEQRRVCREGRGMVHRPAGSLSGKMRGYTAEGSVILFGEDRKGDSEKEI